MRKTQPLVLSALFSAAGAAVLYIGSLLPTGQPGMAALASLFTAAAVWQCGVGWGISAYVVTAALGLLLMPGRTVPLIYAVFFGYYPLVKRFTDRFEAKPINRLFAISIRLVVLNAAITALIYLFSVSVFDLLQNDLAVWLVYVLANAAFLVFDYCMSRFETFYRYRIMKAGFPRGRQDYK